MTIIGGASVLYEFRPKISVAEGHTLDERDAFATQFLITNDSSFFDLRDVEATCGLNEVKTSSSRFINSRLWDPRTARIGTIPPGESATAPCPFSELISHYGTVPSADIQIDMDYGYILRRGRLHKTSRFVTQAGTCGVLHWFPKPR